jgi:hypothetical protein
MTVIINELEVVAAPSPGGNSGGTAQPPTASPSPPTARDLRIVLVHQLERLNRVQAT